MKEKDINLDNHVIEKTKDSISFYVNPDIQKMQLKASTPCSAPTFSKAYGKKWIPYREIGDKLPYPDKLIRLMESSAVHGSIVKSDAEMTIGNGFKWKETAANSEKLNEWSLDINGKGETLDVQGAKVSLDLKLFGGFALQVEWSKSWDKIIGIEHLDFSKLRALITDAQGKVPGYLYAWDWITSRPAWYVLETFNPKGAVKQSEEFKKLLKESKCEEIQKAFAKRNIQIIYYKPHRPGHFYYPIPGYSGCLNYVETEILSSIYGVGAFKSGLSSSYIVFMYGFKTEEARDKASRKFLYAHAQLGFNQPIIAHSEDAEHAIKIEKIEGSTEDKRFTKINENAIQNIISAHRMPSPMLAGIRVPGQLGGSTELIEAAEIHYTQVIQPKQLIISEVYNQIMRINKYPEIEIERLSPSRMSIEEEVVEDMVEDEVKEVIEEEVK